MKVNYSEGIKMTYALVHHNNYMGEVYTSDEDGDILVFNTFEKAQKEAEGYTGNMFNSVPRVVEYINDFEWSEIINH